MDNAGAKMRRTRRTHHNTDDDDYQSTSTVYQTLHNETDDFLQMERMGREASPKYRFENTIEAKVEDGDTLQALALRFHCTVADIKRLNKIDKDNEIHARKVVKIPVTVHSVLLGTLPGSVPVHTSGSNSPNSSPKVPHEDDAGGRSGGVSKKNDSRNVHNARNPLDDKRMLLSEKLMIASVNAGGATTTSDRVDENATVDSFLNLKKPRNAIYANYKADNSHDLTSAGVNTALLSDILQDDEPMSRIIPIPGPSAFHALQWSGSDCDMSWVCLFVVILALCFIIPLVCVIYFAEHAHHQNVSTSH